MNQISRDELKKYMDQYQLDHTIGDLTPTVCGLFGVPEPEVCGACGVLQSRWVIFVGLSFLCQKKDFWDLHL